MQTAHNSESPHLPDKFLAFLPANHIQSPWLAGPKIAPEKQRQHSCDDMRLTESGNTSSKQLLMRPT